MLHIHLLDRRSIVSLMILACLALWGSVHRTWALNLRDDKHPSPLAIGSLAPDFRLPGVDGKVHSLDEFRNARALAVIFTAVHCPTAEVYEERIKKLVAEYRPKGVAFVGIQPNSPLSLRLDEMG